MDDAAVRPRLQIRWDLRAVEGGTPHHALYAAMLEQVRWADRQGFDAAAFSEHHCAEDGYLPSPLVTAAAAAGVTSRLRIQVSALVLPLYDVVRVAEDLAVLDLLSDGRLDVVVGAGYRPAEFESHGRSLPQRFTTLERHVEVLRRAWTGEPFEHEGRTVHVTPRPRQPGGPPLYFGGASVGAARRAARFGDGFFPVSHVLEPAYYEACAQLGKPPGVVRGTKGPMFVHVTDDPDRSWAQIAPHALHETNSYGRWIAEAGDLGPYGEVADADALRATGNYVMVSPAECVQLARDVGTLTLHPLMGGLNPAVAAESLALVESEVLPQLR